MSITLSDGSTTINLPDDLQWVDKYLWNKQRDQVDITLAGGLVIQNSVQIKGRPITLAGGDDFAWMNKTDMDSIYTMIDEGSNLTLKLNDGSIYTVRFRYEENPIKATPIEPGLTTYNNITIELKEV